MKRLITILTFVALISGISVAAFAEVPTEAEDVVVTWNINGWILLRIPTQVVELVRADVHVIDHPYPIYHSIDAPFSVYVRTNVLGGFTLIVTASVNTEPTNASNVLLSFYISGGDLGVTWHNLSAQRTLFSSMSPGCFSAGNIRYQFRSNPRYHPPGDYQITITHTATAP